MRCQTASAITASTVAAIWPTATQQPYVLFLHGTTWDSKHWPEAHWRSWLSNESRKAGRALCRGVIASEKARAERIAAGIETRRSAAKLNLAGVAKVIAGASACVAVDTGLGHLAAALDVPSISLYGPTLPGRVGAYGRGRRCTSAPPGPHAGSW